MKLNIKNRGAVSVAVTLVGSLIGLGLLGAVVLKNADLSHRENFLAIINPNLIRLLNPLAPSTNNDGDPNYDYSPIVAPIPGAGIVPPMVCTDTDGGKDYYKRGKGTGLYSFEKQVGFIWGEDPNKVSARFDSSLDYSIHYDACSDSSISNQLNEAYCAADGALYAEGYQCPNGCSNGACLTAPPTPSIKVLSPNGGEKWESGKNHRVTWSSSAVKSVLIAFNYTPAGSSGYTYLYAHGIYDPIPASQGYYDLTVPSFDKFGGGEGGNVRITIFNSDNTLIFDDSDAPFTITASIVTEPKLTISVSTSVSTAPSAQNVIAGTNQFEFARYILDASASGEDIKIDPYFPVKYTVVSGNATDLTNCYLFDGSMRLNSLKVENPSLAGHLTFWFDSGMLTVSKGSAKQLSLKCDVKATAFGVYQFGYDRGF